MNESITNEFSVKVRGWIKTACINLWHNFQKLGFWVIVLLAIGGYFGRQYEEKNSYYRIDTAIVLGSFMHEKTGRVYNVTLDPSRNGSHLVDNKPINILALTPNKNK